MRAGVAVAGGEGRLVRRESALLFDPTGDSADLAAGFRDAATDADAVDVAKRYLIDSEFAAAPFVVVVWPEDGVELSVDLLVFGDVEVATSAVAAPMVTGAGSASWIERHLGGLELAGATSAEIWSGSDVDASTDLQLGTVLGSGFRLSLATSDTRAAATGEIAQAAPRARSTTEVPAVAPGVVERASAEASAPEAPVEVPPAPDRAAASAETPASIESSSSAVAEASPPPARPVPPQSAASAEAVNSANAPAEPTSAPPPDLSDTDSGQPAPPADASPTSPLPEPHDPFTADPSTRRPSPAAPTPPTPPVVDAFGDDPPTLPGDEVELIDATQPAPQDDVAIPDPFATPAANVGLVEATMCANRHANPPQSSACTSCGVAIEPDAIVTLIEQPVVGQLIFSDGQLAEVDRQILIGRKPATEDDNSIAIALEFAEVSRSHAVVAVEGWAALLTDRGSRNGTYVCPPSNPTPIRLEEGVPHYLEAGTVVHFGAPEASFTFQLPGASK